MEYTLKFKQKIFSLTSSTALIFSIALMFHENLLIPTIRLLCIQLGAFMYNIVDSLGATSG